MSPNPSRGEVWLVDLGMAAKTRPGLILSVPAGDVDRALVTLVPHTTSTRGSHFEVSINVGFLRAPERWPTTTSAPPARAKPAGRLPATPAR